MPAQESTTPPMLPPGSDEDRSPPYMAFTIALSVLITLAVILRFWSRSLGARQMSGRSVGRFWWDDWTALIAFLLIWIYFALAFAEVQLGFGRHIWMVPPENLGTIFKLLYCIYFLYDVSLFVTKLSALLFFTRIFPAHANTTLWNWTLWITHGMNVAWFVGIVFGTVFMCDPVAKGWNPMLPGKCGTTSSLWIGSAVPSVTIDLIILLLPVPKILSLRISGARKAGILVVFMLGYSVIVVSLGRLITVIKSADALNADITYEGMPMVYWVTCEAPVTLISICLPPMVNLLKRFNTTLLTPFGSKISSVWSSYTTTNPSLKSHDGNFSSAVKSNVSDVKSKNYTRATSTESRTELVDRDDGASPIQLSVMPGKGSEPYSTSARGGGVESRGLDGNGNAIYVEREITSVSHLAH